MSIVRVVGGPGTGKSTRLIDAAVAHIAGGGDPESVLLLTSARLAVSTRGAITARLLNAGSGGLAVVREPLVRSVHSYAFGVLRNAAARAGDPPPRLVTGAEQDAVIRELLAGDLDDGARGWPRELRPALTTVGFATELRDLLARCAQRGVDADELQRIGRAAGHPEWVGAARFARQYEQVMLLRAAVGTAAPQACVPALSAAELVGVALEALAADADLLAAERARIRLLLVDDAQHLDPQAATLVRVLAVGSDRTLLAGDPNQAVFGFRGADADLLSLESPVITLTRSHRCAPAIARAISGVAAGLPGTGWRVLDGGDDNAAPGEGSGENPGENPAENPTEGSVAVTVAASAHAEAAVIADALRRAHLIDGVPWSQLAVIVRSVAAAAALTRSLAVAGVPVDQPTLRGAVGDQPGVRALHSVLTATESGLDDETAEALLTGPIGRVDPVSLRQLRRALRRTDRSLREALTGPAPQLPATLAAPVKRVRSVLTAAARSHRSHHDPRFTLWQAWERSGLQRRWVAAADRGGIEGALAERNLGAVTALFDIAEAYVARTAGASLSGLLEHVAALQLPPVGDTAPAGETVAVLSPHAALGRDWEMVVIAGLQDGLWPNITPRGGVLGTQRLLDVLDGLGADVSVRAPLLAEERRLLIAAMGRARRRLLITAVDSDAGDEALLPSVFIPELARLATGDVPAGPVAPVQAPQLLSPAAVVGRLRAVVCAPQGVVEESRRACAAEQLGRLAAAGVPGADPRQWHGLGPVSTQEPLFSSEEHTVTLSPSTLQTLTDCPLRWLAERHGGAGARALNSTLGSVVHALVAESSKSEAHLIAELENVWAELPFDSPWYAANELDRHRAMLAAFISWRAATRHELTEVGTEVELDGVLAEPSDGLPGVRVRGRIDRLERDAQGRLVVVDVKTARSPVTKDDAQQHAQLGLYQLAVSAGLLDGDHGDGDSPGGGRLVYVGKAAASGSATEREQSAVGPDDTAQWLQTVRAAAAATAGPHFAARVNDGCSHCPIKPTCPAHTTGAHTPGEEPS
ncbi:UvrD Superfamily I DNA and RNA helicases [Mycobacteriaceae bacterium]